MPEVQAAQAEAKLPIATLSKKDSDGNYTVGHATQMIMYAPDGTARIVYPFGTRQGDWTRDLPRLIAANDKRLIAAKYGGGQSAMALQRLHQTHRLRGGRKPLDFGQGFTYFLVGAAHVEIGRHGAQYTGDQSQEQQLVPYTNSGEVHKRYRVPRLKNRKNIGRHLVAILNNCQQNFTKISRSWPISFYAWHAAQW